MIDVFKLLGVEVGNRPFRIVLTTSLSIFYFLLVFLNFNLPVIQQIFSHNFFYKTEVEYAPDGRSFSCIAPSCSPRTNIYEQNKAFCPNSAAKKYVFKIDEEEFFITRDKYTGQSCAFGYRHGYYFPLMPSFAVLDNSMPDQKLMSKFYDSLLFTFCFTLLGTFVIIFQKHTAVFHSRDALIIVAFSIPFVAMPLFGIFNLRPLFAGWFNIYLQEDVLAIFHIISALTLLIIVEKRLFNLVLAVLFSFLAYIFHAILIGFHLIAVLLLVFIIKPKEVEK